MTCTSLYLGGSQHHGILTLVERTVFEVVHDDVDGDAFRRDTKLLSYRVDHRARHIDRCRNFLSPCPFTRLAMVEQSNPHGERALLLDYPRMKPCEGLAG